MSKVRYFIKVKGIVQGVGFRPYVYKLAVQYDLKGWVNNNSEGVFIDVEGSRNILDAFLEELKKAPPTLSRVDSIDFEIKQLSNYKDFSIKASQRLSEKITLISPDTATCQDCIDDILNSNNPRFNYAFTNCTNCGPRFSIIEHIPYDRINTTMKDFKMCKFCDSEYHNPMNRRFHAQPIACNECGPEVWLEALGGKKISCSTPIVAAGKVLAAGKILAIKGLGGFHLACDANNQTVLEELRVRKHRPDKPFAVMVKDINVARKYCYISKEEEVVLTGSKKPILILRRKENLSLPEAIAPKQSTLGVMLPYTPLHHLLFQNSPEVLVMTSANLNSLPLEYENVSAAKSLNNIVDLFLMHNRDIFIPIDDSVAKVINGDTFIYRKARGYTPEPIEYTASHSILACGSNMKNTFSISKDNYIFMSQHNGDLENLETTEHYIRNINHFKNIFNFSPEYIACDMHPKYSSTVFAEEQNLPLIKVQHHHAHIVSCMVENAVKTKVIGLAFDGTGYGEDNAIWGGEFFLTELSRYERIAHIEYVKMIGNDIAIKEPWRMAVSYINHSYNNSSESQIIIKELFGEKALLLNSMIDSGINCIKTSSMGRLFDAVAAILGICPITSYEGQASIELESAIDINTSDYYSYKISKINFPFIVSTSKIINGIIADIFTGCKKGYIAAKFHNTIIKFSSELCNSIRANYGIDEVALSGGVFQNEYLTKNLIAELSKNNFIVYTNKSIPTNDGGISIGQLIAADEMLKQRMTSEK